MYEGYNLINLIFRATIIPGSLLMIWLIGLISLATIQLCILSFSIIFILLPIIFRYSVTLQRGILFLTFITYPKDLDLSNPSSVGLYGTRSFFLNVQDTEDADDDKNEENTVSNTDTLDNTNHEPNPQNDGIKIGVWHVLPKSILQHFATQLQVTHEANENDVSLRIRNALNSQDNNLTQLAFDFPTITSDNEQAFYERTLNMPRNTIVLYLHGNTASRGSGHRLDVYKLLRKLDYHVITLDYRGYGDSDPVSPTEEGIVNDALAAYKYITSVTTNPVIIWGHSLGTGVATHLLSKLNYMNDIGPRGVILEAPFTNIRDEIRQHPFAKPFKHLPWFDITISRPMYSNSLRFESDQHISEFRQPVLILHAEDDYVVPFQLGYKLYRIALDTRGKSCGPVEFHRFPAIHKYGHKHICYAPELPDLIQSFVDTYRQEYF